MLRTADERVFGGYLISLVGISFLWWVSHFFGWRGPPATILSEWDIDKSKK
jgi:hypothetical protein